MTIAIATLFLFLFINSVFVFKYVRISFVVFEGAVLLYVVSASVALLLMSCRPIELLSSFFGRWGRQILIAAVSAGVLLALLASPDNAEVGRAAGIFEWWNSVLSGDFPYGGAARPSGMPGLYLLQFPFYLIGNPAWLSVLSYLLFVYVAAQFGSSYRPVRVAALVGLSPAFIYEVAVRSDLSAVMLVASAWALLVARWHHHAGWRRWLLILSGGVLLSTRMAVWPLVLLTLAAHLKRPQRGSRAVPVGIAAVFVVVTFWPLLWNAGAFWEHGPFAVQGQYLPPAVALLGLVAVVAGVSLVRTVPGALVWSAFILFGVVFTLLVYYGIGEGFSHMILADNFDISYFCFALPPAVFGLASFLNKVRLLLTTSAV